MNEHELPIEDYQEFLEHKHSKLNTSPEIITQAIKEATGSLPKKSERLIKGEVNEVYAITTQDERECIIRISHRDTDSFTQEEYVINQARDVGIPVPEVLLVTKAVDKDRSITICIEKKIPGTPLNELENLNSSERNAILYQAGAILSKLHEIKTNGYGDVDLQGKGEHADLASYVRDRCDARGAFIEAAKDVKLDSSLIDRAIDILQEKQTILISNGPRLLHNDFSPKHILVDKGEVTGIIDWEIAKGGEPLEELARWDFFFHADFPLDTLRKGYQNKELLGENFEQQIHFWKIYFGLGVLRYYVGEKNISGIRHTKTQLEKDVEYFK